MLNNQKIETPIKNVCSAKLIKTQKSEKHVTPKQSQSEIYTLQGKTMTHQKSNLMNSNQSSSIQKGTAFKSDKSSINHFNFHKKKPVPPEKSRQTPDLGIQFI